MNKESMVIMTLRMPPAMHKKLKAEAKRNFISINTLVLQSVKEHQGK